MTACSNLQASTNKGRHQLVTCNEGKFIRCLRCHERKPSSDAKYWQKSPCWSEHWSRAPEASSAATQEELEEAEQVVGTVSQIQAKRRKRAAEAAARRQRSRKNRAVAQALWIRSLPARGTLLQRRDGAQSIPRWAAQLRWQSHKLYSAGGLVFCSQCGHMASCFRKGALTRSCASGKLVAIPKGSEFRRDQLLMGSLAGTTLTEWPNGTSKGTRLAMIRVTAAIVAALGASGSNQEKLRRRRQIEATAMRPLEKRLRKTTRSRCASLPWAPEAGRSASSKSHATPAVETHSLPSVARSHGGELGTRWNCRRPKPCRTCSS